MGCFVSLVGEFWAWATAVSSAWELNYLVWAAKAPVYSASEISSKFKYKGVWWDESFGLFYIGSVKIKEMHLPEENTDNSRSKQIQDFSHLLLHKGVISFFSKRLIL